MDYIEERRNPSFRGYAFRAGKDYPEFSTNIVAILPFADMLLEKPANGTFRKIHIVAILPFADMLLEAEEEEED